ncbi:MAG: hypothetical protein QOG72_2219 [Sphingomonadales bacterium]|jgi:hypothetical protein|nr:hypothetical protein [Sphingomonadales bacterium]
MKAKIGSIEVEGTPDEIATLLQRINFEGRSAGLPPEPPATAGRHYVSEEVAFRALKRRSLSVPQGLVLSKLKADYPAWTLAKDLQTITGYNRNQLAGLFGAFGKRVAGTDGYLRDTWLFDVEWNYDADCYQYRLPPTVHSALERAGI